MFNMENAESEEIHDSDFTLQLLEKLIGSLYRSTRTADRLSEVFKYNIKRQ